VNSFIYYKEFMLVSSEIKVL